MEFVSSTYRQPGNISAANLSEQGDIDIQLSAMMSHIVMLQVYRAQTARLIPKKRSAPEHREEGPPSEPVQKRMRSASDPTSSPAARSKLQPPAARVEPTW